MCRVVAPFVASALLLTACVRQKPVSVIDERSPRWAEWASRIQALPVCLPLEFEAVPRGAPPVVPGDTVQVRGTLGLLELDCSNEVRELVLRGLGLPDPGPRRSLREIDDAVARAERRTCGSMLGLRVGAVELSIEPPLAERAWRENDAELFDALLAQTDAIVVGVVEATSGRLAIVQPTRVCRAEGPALERVRLRDDGVQWELLDGLEYLSHLPAVSRTRRAQALRVLFDVAAHTAPGRARRAAERLRSEFGDDSRLGRRWP